MDVLKVNDTYHILLDKAQSIIEDKQEVIKVLAKAEKRLQEFPEGMSGPDKMELMLEMVKAYLNKEYPITNEKALCAILAAAIYLSDDGGIISNDVPIIGFMDDVALIDLAYRDCENEVKAYGLWKKNRGGII